MGAGLEELSQLAIDDELEPWDTVRRDVCANVTMTDAQREQLMRLYLAPSPITDSYLRDVIGLDGIDLQPSHRLELDALLGPSQEEGGAAFARLETAINAELRNKCARGDYFYGPYTTGADTRKSNEPALVMRAFIVRGWAVRVMVFLSDLPYVQDDLAVLERMKTVQRPIIAAYLLPLRRR